MSTNDQPQNGSDSETPERKNGQGSMHEHLEAEVVSIEQGGAQTVNAERVTVSQGGIQNVNAQYVEIQQGGAAQIQAGEIHVQDGGIGLVQAELAELNGVQAGAIIATNVRSENTRTGLLIASQIDGNVETVIDARAALFWGAALGATAGFVFALLSVLLGRRSE